MVAFVVPHDPDWKMAFKDEAKAIEQALGTTTIQLHHIGSTAIPGILAKPIIDIVGEVPCLHDLDAETHVFESLGYEVMGAYGIEGRRYFRKVDRGGTRTHHLHAFEAGSHHAERLLAFRDYLTAHPEVAREYSELKNRLARDNGINRDAYMGGKDPFVRRIEPLAIDFFRKSAR